MADGIKERFTFSIAVLGSIALFFGAGYLFGKDSASSLNESLKEKNKFLQTVNNNQNALEYLSELKTYNENLFDLGRYAKDKIELEDKNKALTKQNRELEEEFELQTQELSDLKANLNSFQAQVKKLRMELQLKFAVEEEFELKVAQSKSILEGTETIGVTSIYSSRIVLTLRDKNVYLDVGQSAYFSVPENKCRITLMSITPISPLVDASRLSLKCTSETKP